MKKKKTAMDKNDVMALSFGALNLVDYLTTRRILNTGGDEYNPAVRFLTGKKCFGLFKTAATLTGMLAIHAEDEPKSVSKALLGFYGFVVAHNLKEIVMREREIRRERQTAENSG